MREAVRHWQAQPHGGWHRYVRRHRTGLNTRVTKAAAMTGDGYLRIGQTASAAEW